MIIYIKDGKKEQDYNCDEEFLLQNNKHLVVKTIDLRDRESRSKPSDPANKTINLTDEIKTKLSDILIQNLQK